MYGILFSYLADQVADAKKDARELMRQVLEKGIEPEDLQAFYSLVELDLAWEEDAMDYTGNTILHYVNPEDLE